MPLVLTSPDFTHQGSIPQQYTCQGRDVSPPLSWSGAPEGTKSFVLIMDDPDAPDPAAPKRTWVHWVLYDDPGHVSSLRRGGHLREAARRARARARTTGTAPATAGRARPSAGIATSTSSTRSTSSCPTSGARARPRSRRRWKGTSWPRRS